VNILFVGNLPYETTEADLARWFEAAGIEIDSVSLQVDRFSGGSRGFAYVVLESDTKTAVRECNGRSFRGRTLVVSQPPPSRSPQSTELTAFAQPF
jgi:RNA recognition motif-containing protein